LFQGTGNVLQQSSSLFWDSTNERLGIGTATPNGRFHVKGSVASEIFKAESTIAALYAQFVSSDGACEFGIYTDALYFQPLPSLANGTRFLNGGNTIIMQLAQTGNVQIGTTTDAGFRLDVNGTARVKTNLKIETSTDGLTIEGDAGGYPTLKINTLRSGTTRRNWMFATEQFAAGDFVLFRSSTGGGAANTQVYSIFNDGNFGLNTSTNAGFRLDVNGTARVASGFQANGNVIFGTSNGFYWDSATQRLGIGTNSPQAFLHFNNSTGEKIRMETAGTLSNFISIYNSGVSLGYIGKANSTTDLYYMNSSAANLIFGTNNIERMRIKSNGVINMSAIPTSSAGLSAGDLWNDGGTLKIV
jgi:hypothetical protein